MISHFKNKDNFNFIMVRKKTNKNEMILVLNF